jgi:hypothetical protein
VKVAVSSVGVEVHPHPCWKYSSTQLEAGLISVKVGVSSVGGGLEVGVSSFGGALISVKVAVSSVGGGAQLCWK